MQMAALFNSIEESERYYLWQLSVVVCLIFEIVGPVNDESIYRLIAVAQPLAVLFPCS